LAEPIKPDYLFADASRIKHGLTVAFAANEAGLTQPIRTEISDTGSIRKPDAAGDVAYDPTLAVRMTGVLVPPMTGEYQIGAKCAMRSGFQSTAKWSSTKCKADSAHGQFGISMEKDKPYNVLVEFSHSLISGERMNGQIVNTGTAEGPATTPARVASGTQPTAAVYNPGGRGGRGGRGGQPYGSTPEFPDSRLCPYLIPTGTHCSSSPGQSPLKRAFQPHRWAESLR